MSINLVTVRLNPKKHAHLIAILITIPPRERSDFIRQELERLWLSEGLLTETTKIVRQSVKPTTIVVQNVVQNVVQPPEISYVDDESPA